MSSILKALKKVEQERASQRDGAVNITFDVIKGGDCPVRRVSPVVVALFVGGGLLVGATFIWWRAGAPVESFTSARQTSTAIEVVIPVERPKEVIVPSPVPVEKALPVASPSPVLAQPLVVTAPIAVTPPVTQRPPVTPVSVEIETPFVETVIVKEQLPPVTSQAVIPEFEDERFLLSTIVDDPVPENRLAIINDFPVMEGTMIDDALVVEILPDRVSLNISGELFMIHLRD